jgi:ABC-2 type transport system ATP-binding protein
LNPPTDPVRQNTAGASAPLLSVCDVHKKFVVKGGPAIAALRGVSFEVHPREVVGVVGPDGAGKTTLMRIVAGLLVPEQGTATVLGFDSVRATLKIQDRISYMPQKFGLYQDLTCQENLDLYADLQGVEIAARPPRYARLLAMTGLEKFSDRLAGKLSGGMKQKLGLACALVKRPELLLLDEPTVGVDPVSRRELWRIVYEMVEGEGIGVLVATAYLDEAEKCRRVVVLHEGRKLDEGEPAMFRERIRGHSFIVTPAAGVRPRSIQARLVGQPGVVDATVRGGRVRVVTQLPDSDALNPALPKGLVAGINPAVSTFEDAFLKMLADVRGAPKKAGVKTPELKTAAAEASKPPSSDVVVQTHNLTKKFGDFTAVSGITFTVNRGEIFGLLGPNGAGKSTTFRMLCGLSKVSAGDVRVAGHDLRRTGAFARQHLGYMAQQFSLYGQLSVFENLRFFGRAYGLDRDELAQRIEWALDEFDLREHRDEAAGMMPVGYKQRLAMAAALLHEPDLLFLDEPTSGVDPLARRDFWRRINAFAESGVTVIVTTHFMEEAEYCDRMLIMSQGRELATGTPDEIRALARNAAHPNPTIEDAFIALAEGTAKPLAKEPRP